MSYEEIIENLEELMYQVECNAFDKYGKQSLGEKAATPEGAIAAQLMDARDKLRELAA